MPIRRLSDETINRIAAGEVIERPASVVKELVENAIDAGARRIEITTAAGGISLLRVADDGSGMTRADLALAVERHCTSKIVDDLMSVRTLGFRGEALASIGAVAHLSVASKHRSEEHGWEISVDGGRLSGVRPASIASGTRVDVSDLFFATPARLKFLKSERAETTAITDVVKRIAMAHPQIRFILDGTDRHRFEAMPAEGADGARRRIADVMGEEFIDNAVPIDVERENVRISGFAGLPTYTRANALMQHIFVNGRPVRDKLLSGALRAGYADLMARDRHPAVVLFITLPSREVDVNVHPAKAEVRFRDQQLVRGLMVGALRTAFAGAPLRASTTGGRAAITSFRRRVAFSAASRPGAPSRPFGAGFGENEQTDFAAALSRALIPTAETMPQALPGRIEAMPAFDPAADLETAEAGAAEKAGRQQLGVPRAQLHANYIVAQTEDSIVIVDQHAAHERLVYEKLKKGMAERGVARQILLIPEIIDLPQEDVDRLAERSEELVETGLVIERFGPGAIAVMETPAMLGEMDVAGLIRDLADEVAEWGSAEAVRDRLDRLASTLACHGSVRSGRQMKVEEMDALLREMEATPNSGQCNHGRPTFIELKLTDIERLFGRR